MISRERFVEAVKKCVGTPCRHMGRRVGAGLDCVGVPLAALAMCGSPLPEPKPYGSPPGAGLLIQQLEQHCDPIEHGRERPGDLLLAMWKGEPRHVMVCVGHDDAGRIVTVHARGRSGRVTTEPLSEAYRVVSIWRLRGVV